ncbi:hypothetical protein HAX54_032109, partial [Datura stramonium]|nr:hypothetical protein [Datura stramonium]
ILNEWWSDPLSVMINHRVKESRKVQIVGKLDNARRKLGSEAGRPEHCAALPTRCHGRRIANRVLAPGFLDGLGGSFLGKLPT